MICFHKIKFCVTLKVWRKLHQFTQGEMAEMAGFATSTYGFIEAGSNPPNMEQFVSLCKVMDYNPSEFFADESKL